MFVWPFLFILVGCATVSPPFGDISRLDAEVGRWTYSDAAARYGPPDQKKDLKDGGIIAEWIRERSEIYRVEEYDPRASRPVPAQPNQWKYRLKMIFDRDQILRSWSFESNDLRFPSKNGK